MSICKLVGKPGSPVLYGGALGPQRGFFIIRLIVASLLAAAAAFKSHELVTDTGVQDQLLYSPILKMTVIEVELALALSLLAGPAIHISWFLTSLFFFSAAGISLYQGVEKQRSCGCFGALSPTPWWTFAGDLLVLGCLCIWRPKYTQTKLSPRLRSAFLTILATLLLLAGTAAVFVLGFDDPTRALAALRGELIKVEPIVTDMGDGDAGEERIFTVRLTNREDRAVQIVGGTSNCACLATGDLPIELPAGESRSIRVRARFRGVNGRFQHLFALYTNENRQPVVTAGFAGRVLQPTSP